MRHIKFLANISTFLVFTVGFVAVIQFADWNGGPTVLRFGFTLRYCRNTGHNHKLPHRVNTAKTWDVASSDGGPILPGED